MKAVISAASALAITAGASAAPFQFLSFEAGGPVDGIVGQGFGTTGGTFYKEAGNPSLLNAGPFLYGILPSFEQDSYFSIDSFGPTVSAGNQAATRAFYGDYPMGDYTASNAGTLPFSTILGPGSTWDPSAVAPSAAYLGLGIAPQPFLSGFAPLAGGGGRSDLDGVFIARLTVADGESPIGGGLFSTQDGAAEVEIDGPAADFGGQQLGLVSYLIPNAGGNGDTYDIWFQVIPTPGSIALLGIGGVAALRRRRA